MREVDNLRENVTLNTLDIFRGGDWKRWDHISDIFLLGQRVTPIITDMNGVYK